MKMYFQYRWEKDKNLANSTREDKELLEQLPISVQHDIYLDFLFKSLMFVYKTALAYDVGSISYEQTTLLLKMRIKISD